MRQKRMFLVLCFVVAMLDAGCRASNAAPTVPINPALPTASNTPHTEVSSTPNLPTPELQPSLTPTPGPLLSPAPYLPSTFTGAVPLGAVARLGQGVLNIVRVSPDGKYLAVGGSMGVTVYETASYSQVWFGRTAASVSKLEWSPDGRRTAAVLDDRVVIVWDASNGVRVVKIEEGGSFSLTWSPDSARLVVGGYGPNATVWDAATGARLLRIDPASIPVDPADNASLTSAALSPNGRLIATTYVFGGGDAFNSGTRADIWDAATGQYLRTLVGEASFEVAWSPDNRYLAVADNEWVTIWNVETGETIWELTADYFNVVWLNGIYWAPDGKAVAVDDYRNCAVFSLETGSLLPSADGRLAGWSPDGHRYALLEDGEMIIRDARDGGELRRIDGINYVAGFSPDWSTFYGWVGTGSSDFYGMTGTEYPTLVAWDVQTGEQRSAIVTGTRWVQSLTWSPDGTRVATGSVDYMGSTVMIWNAITGGALHSINFRPNDHEIKTQVAWSPDGNTLAVGTNGYTFSLGADGQAVDVGSDGLVLLDAQDGRTIEIVETGKVDSLVWSPDSAMIAIGGADATVSVWDIRRKILLHRLEGHKLRDGEPDSVRSVDWSADGAMIVSAGSDGQVILWNVSTGEQIRVLDVKQPDAGTREVYSIAFSPNSSLLAVATRDETYTQDGINLSHYVTVWDVKTGTLVHKLQGPQPQHSGSEPAIVSMDWSTDGSRLAAAYGSPQELLFGHMFSIGGSSIVVVWDATTGQIQHEFDGHTSDVQSVAFSPDGVHLASGSLDGTVIVWDVSQ